MPGRNGSGPLGNGPMTGRGMGNCNRPAKGQEGTQGMDRGQGRGPGLGRGQGRGMGQGRGLGRRQGVGAGQNQDDSKPNLTNTVIDEKAQLIQQAENLQTQLDSIKTRLSELEN